VGRECLNDGEDEASQVKESREGALDIVALIDGAGSLVEIDIRECDQSA